MFQWLRRIIAISMGMSFRRIASAEPAAAYLAGCLSEHLKAGERVLWLVPGGSGAEVAARTSQLLQGTPLENLTITLTDERYGPVGHPDSNWLHLAHAGMHVTGAHLAPVLHGEDLRLTAEQFADRLKQLLSDSDYRLGLFGIGDDGHTAGILPGSPALRAKELAASFDTETFQRVTITPPAIARLTEAVVYAVGSNKYQQLERLEQDVAAAEQPAQILKLVPKLTIFNDAKGENV